uniref:Major facilitator superfamily (MFS) profile domain-containing protein n=1 Tax=Globisporangium ultimum (strain ATCC 200006 / CBS 805.95 / DAOM BR144) TaxID=431595 RepID=K3WGI8_GLOUD
MGAPPSPHAERIAPKRVALVAAVFLSDLLLTGLVFGWAPLLLMLQDEQQYVELCDFDSAEFEDDSVAHTCVAQENKLNLMFAVASVTMNAGALPIGFFLDYAGPKIVITAAAVIEVSGLVLLAMADSQSFDVFLPAYTLLAFGGSMTMMSSFPASFLILQYQTAILAAISCLFDGSSVVFLVLYAMKSSFDLTRQQLLLALAAVAASIYVALIALWHVNEHALAGDDSETDSLSGNERDTLLLQPADPEREHYPSNNDANNASSSMLLVESGHYGSVERMSDDASELVDVPIRKQMQSVEFVYVVVFAAVQVLRATIYIGTTNKLLDNYGDHAYGYFFTKVFSFVLPLGFLFVPFIDHIVEQKGLACSLVFTNLLGVLYNVLVLVPSLHVQCLTFFVFAGYRAFLYAVMSAFTAKTFGLKNMGSLMGIIFSIGSVVSLAEYPAVFVSNAYLDGDLTVVYCVSLVLCILLFPYTAYLSKHEEKRERMHQEYLYKHHKASASAFLTTPTHGLTYLRSPMVGKSPGRKSRFSSQA